MYPQRIVCILRAQPVGFFELGSVGHTQQIVELPIDGVGIAGGAELGHPPGQFCTGLAFLELFRRIAPGLKERVGEQTVGQDPSSQIGGQHRLAPPSVQKPVICDLVIVEHHVRGYVGQRAPHVGQGALEDLKRFVQLTNIDLRSEHGRPGGQIHGIEFSQEDQMAATDVSRTDIHCELGQFFDEIVSVSRL